MAIFDWLFRKRTAVSKPEKKYEYPTGNTELAVRVNKGELLPVVLQDIRVRWTPGNEHLWDEYDAESLIDTEEKARFVVNQLLYSRITMFRALRALGKCTNGRDPFEFVADAPAVMDQLRRRFPAVLAGP